jgi:hypothetical protein
MHIVHDAYSMNLVKCRNYVDEKCRLSYDIETGPPLVVVPKAWQCRIQGPHP